MVKRLFMLLGPQIGRVIDGVADADAATAATDGWGRELVPGGPYPFDSSGTLPNKAWPNSLRNWLTKIYGGTDVSYPNSVTLACVSVSKANPTVVTLSAVDAAKIANGNSVVFSGTGTALDAAGSLTTANKTGNTFTVPVDLSTIPATVTGKGTVTKLVA